MAPSKKTKSKKVKTPSSKAPALIGKPVLRYPHISEKATTQERQGIYVLRVRDDATKIDVKRAVARRFSVTPTAVRMARMPRKMRRVGRTVGFAAGYKKAYVTLKAGQTITGR